MLAFKLSAKKRVGTGKYESREKKEVMKIGNVKMKTVEVSGSENGFGRIKENGKDQGSEE